MLTITDQIQIFSFLEKFNQTDFNPNENCVRQFLADDHLALLLFCFGGNSKGAKLYLLSSPPTAEELHKELLPQLIKIEGDSMSDDLREKAMTIYRELSSQHNSANYFFEAH